MDVKIVLELEGFREFPRVLVQQEPGNQLGGLEHRALLTPFESFGVGEPTQCSAGC